MDKARIRLVSSRVLGLIACSVIIWFVGPLFAFAGVAPLESEWARWCAIGGLVFAYLVTAGLRWLLRRRNNIRMVVDMMANAKVPDQHAAECAGEVEALRARFEEALAVLRRAPLGKKSRWGVRRYLYQLPWYMIIGAPGAGKTTSLLNSGLNFPLANRIGKAEIGGVGGTRNCDWWFSDEAVIIDTAGRYVTQDSRTGVDRAAWTGFLDLLKKYRRRQPLNGVMVAISISELLQQGESERQQHAHLIRSRLQELYDHLAISIPVYVMILKCDLMPGFREFFADLGNQERAQVWGSTLSLPTEMSTDSKLPDFNGEFMGLLRRMEERLVARLQAERDPDKRALILDFPAQFNLACRELGRFLVDVFQPTRFENRVLLRGVYLTSATQEGSPLDRVLGAMAASYGVDSQLLVNSGSKGKSYFVTDLLRAVMFKEAGLAGIDRREERRQVWRKSSAIVGGLALSTVLGLGWFVSYSRNRTYVEEVGRQTTIAQSAMQDLTGQPGDLVKALPALSLLRNLPGGYQEYGQNHPFLSGLGFYQGDKLGSEAVAVYRSALSNVFVPRLLQRLEEQLRNSTDNEFAYEGLRVYLMLFEPQHFDEVAVKAWFDLDWERNLARDALSTRQELQRHLEAVLEAKPVRMPMQADFAMVESVRQRLIKTPIAERIYERLKRSPAAQKLPEFKVSDAAGRDAPLVLIRRSGASLSTGVPGFYTFAGYHQLFKKSSSELIERLTEDSWVYGASGGQEVNNRDAVVQQVQRQYLDEYIKQWDALLADIDLAPFQSAEDGARILGLLSAQDSPLRQLLAAAVKETTLDKVPSDEAALKSGVQSGVGLMARNALNNASTNLRELIGIGQATAQSMQAPVSAPPAEAIVTAHFRPIALLLEQTNGAVAPIDKSLQMFGDLATYLSGVAGAARRGESSAAVQGSEVLGRLKMDAPRQPAPIGTMIRNVMTRSGGLSRGNDRQRLNSLWGATILPFCKQGIDGRYPLARRVTQEVTPDDFGRFFGPNGLLNEFFEKNLRNFVDSSAAVWRWSRAEAGTLGISPAVLSEFQRGAMIRDVFFHGGTQTPAVHFEMKPVRMDAAIAQFTLDLDGQVLTYSHGPIVSTALDWPGPRGSKLVRIEISPPTVSGKSSLSESGPWGLFRLLDKVQINPGAMPERFNVTFNIDGRKATFELAASSVMNPFQLSALEEFHCPSHL